MGYSSRGRKESDTTEGLHFHFLSSVTCSQASLMAQRLKHLPAMRATWVRSLGREHPLEKKWQPTPVFLPGESHGRRSLVGYSSRGRKESDMTERLHSLHSKEGKCLQIRQF